MAYLLKDLTKQEKNARLAAAYRRMNLMQKNALDRMVRNLAELPNLTGRTVAQEKQQKEYLK